MYVHTLPDLSHVFKNNEYKSYQIKTTKLFFIFKQFKFKKQIKINVCCKLTKTKNNLQKCQFYSTFVDLYALKNNY